MCVLALVALLGLTPAAAASARSRSHLATCDEVPGQNAATNDRWRIFYDNESDPLINPQLLACLRSTRPVRRMLHLSIFYARVQLLAGDLAEFANSGKYGNYERYVLDLSTLRSQLISSNSGEAHRDGRLLRSGAIVRLPLDGQAPRTEPVAFDRGVYYQATDGTLRRLAAADAADTAAWPRDRDARWRRFSLRVRPRAGIRTTYLDRYELRRRKAQGRRPAALTLHRPTVESLGFDRISDLVARLVPGSQPELRTVGPLILGRFADRPDELRLRLPRRAPGRFAADLPAPAAGIDAATVVDDGRGSIGYLNGSEMVILIPNRTTGMYAVERLPVPARASDFALAFAPGSRSQLYLTTPDGLPAALPYGPSSAPD